MLKRKSIPMCGVPYHSADNYIETLINKGYKVAICEQMEDPKQTKGMVRREVVESSHQELLWIKMVWMKRKIIIF